MKKVLSISLCLILLLTLLPVVALAGDIFQVTVDVGPNGTIFFGDPPPEGEEDARDVFTSETDPATIEIEANEEGADTTNVFIESCLMRATRSKASRLAIRFTRSGKVRKQIRPMK